MAARFMLDTNAIIAIRSAHEGIMERFDSLNAGEAVMSVISYGELLFGADKSAGRQKAHAILERLVVSIPVADLPMSVARHYGEVRSYLERRGEVIGANDLWIAAHALAGELTLVTGNEREFRRVPGLAVENWAAA